MPKLLLIDGTALVFRAFYGIRNPMLNSQGQPTNATYGFFNILFKTLISYKPDYFAVCFDRSEPTRRHKEYKEYKANRTKAPDELYAQIPVIKHILDTANLNFIEKAGYEADDIIATLDETHNSPNTQNYIYSADFDLLQLVSDHTFVIKPSSKEEKIVNLDLFIKKNQITPAQIPDLKGLSGDASDNLPGVKGIGPKTATKLLLKYNTLEGIYEHIQEIKGANQKKLIQDKDIAFLCKDLAKLNYKTPIDTNLETYNKNNIKVDKLLEEFQKIEFNRLSSRVNYMQKVLELKKAPQHNPLQNSLF
jgi:DNA polymerase-1